MTTQAAINNGSGSRPGGPTFVATREDAAAPFGQPRSVKGAPDPGFDSTSPRFASFVSRDACRLYLHRDGDLWVAHWTPHL